MNFYKHYIGDYKRDTGHLSMTEHGAFRSLLDHHYATEKPLPLDIQALYRLAGALSKTERSAVDKVIKEFFSETDAGYVSKRALKEMGKADHQRDVNRQIAIERENRKRLNDQSTNRDNDQSTNRVTNDQPNQTPDTRRKPLSGSRVTEAETLSRDPPPANPARQGPLSQRLRQLGIDAAPHLLAWATLLPAYSDEEIIAAAQRVREQKPGERISLNYLVPVLSDRKKPRSQSHDRNSDRAATVAAFTSSSRRPEPEAIDGVSTRIA